MYFPDRAFYSDWWNSVEFGSYYRKWNITVHDWLYYYIYIDGMRFCNFLRNHRSWAQILTFIISAVIHELIIACSIGFFYPILFIFFTGPGILLISNQKKLKRISLNFFFWLEIYIGITFVITAYLVESFARKKVPESMIY